jgi:hypothetical protein
MKVFTAGNCISPLQQSQYGLLAYSDYAIISQAAEDVLDNVLYGSFCGYEEIRVAFFPGRGAPNGVITAPFLDPGDTTALEQSREKSAADRCGGQGGAGVEDKRGRA